MDLVGVDPLFNLYSEKWLFRTFEQSKPPSKCIIGGKALESMVSDGCIISGGLVDHSILSPGVIIPSASYISAFPMMSFENQSSSLIPWVGQKNRFPRISFNFIWLYDFQGL